MGLQKFKFKNEKGGGALHRIMFPPLKKPPGINSLTTKY
jgi:hypothetical protein